MIWSILIAIMTVNSAPNSATSIWKFGLPLVLCLLVVFVVFRFATLEFKQVEEVEADALQLPRIAVVLSYDDSYPWQQEILAGIESVTKGQADVVYHNMKTLGISDPEKLEAIGLRARQWVEEQDAQAVIVADDHAMRYVARHEELNFGGPIVFCGVNWPASDYELPQDNLRGMVEFTTAGHLIEMLNDKLPKSARVLILGANRQTDIASANGFRKLESASNFDIDVELVSEFEDWCSVFKASQGKYDFVYILNNAGINNWNHEVASDLTERYTTTLTATEFGWMSDYAVVSGIKSGVEQGVWAAEQSLDWIKFPGMTGYPMVLNRDVRFVINTKLQRAANVSLPEVIRVIGESQ